MNIDKLRDRFPNEKACRIFLNLSSDKMAENVLTVEA